MHYFITNREIIEDSNGREYVREDGKETAGDNLRFGLYDNGNFNLFPEPKEDQDLIYRGSGKTEVEELYGSVKFFRKLYDDLADDSREKNDVLFFIHGFNTNLQGVRDNIKDLHKRYVDDPNSPIEHIIVFTWPGRTPVIPLHYKDDKEDAKRSGKALGRGFEKLIEFFQKFLFEDRNRPCDRKIHLMLHSMGHRVFKHTMLSLQRRGIGTIQPFEEVISMAGDIEYNIFEKDNAFYDLIDFGNRVHIYYHRKDRVLDISKYTKNFSNRLGRYGRRRNDASIADIYDLNVTNVKDDDEFGFKEDKLNHWYYYSSNEVVKDVIQVLNGEVSNFV